MGFLAQAGGASLPLQALPLVQKPIIDAGVWLWLACYVIIKDNSLFQNYQDNGEVKYRYLKKSANH